MRFPGRRNRWGRRFLSASQAATSHGQEVPPSDRLAPNRLEDVFSLAHPVGSHPATRKPPDEEPEPSESTAAADQSLSPDGAANEPSVALTVTLPAATLPAATMPAVMEHLETASEAWELDETDPEAPELVGTVPEVLVPQVPAKPRPAPSGTGRHRSAASSTPVGFLGFGLTVRRAALLGALLLMVVVGALFALM